MSSILYGALSRAREQKPAEDPSPVRTYIDSLAALVPAEVLALEAFFVLIATTKKSVHGKTTVVISDPWWPHTPSRERMI